MSSTRKDLKGKPEPNEGVYAFYPQTRQVKHVSFDPVIARRASNNDKAYDPKQLRETDADGKYIYFEDDNPFGRVEEERQDSDAKRKQIREKHRLLQAQQIYDREKYWNKIGNMFFAFVVSAGIVYLCYRFTGETRGGQPNKKTRKNKRAIKN
jgi:hypothetical protein